MDVHVSHNFKLGACMKDRSSLFDRIGQYMIRVIYNRTTSQHVDADGKAFKAYSSSYARKRAQAGHSAKVNLTGTYGSAVKGYKTGGRMMGAINARQGIVSKSNDHVEIGLSSAEELDKAAYVEEGGREFLGISDKDGKEIEKIIDTWVDEQIATKL